MKTVNHFLILLLILPFANVKAEVFHDPENSEYHYTVDLNTVDEDRIKVELIGPKTDKSTLIFRMPSMVPGTYKVYDFGRFVSDFKATDKKGMPLISEQLDVNSWKIEDANRLYKISYLVDDTWDFSGEGVTVFEPGGSNIEAGQNFMLNTHAFAGYFEGMQSVPFNISISHPTAFFGSTSMKLMNSDARSDTYKIDNYHNLVDAPLMYCVPDTTFIEVGNANVLVSVYSPNHVVTSAQVADNLTELLQAQKEYLGGTLPVDHYAFIIYLTDHPGVSGGMGALEHSYSSVYYLPELNIEQIGPMVRDVCAHEFFHILTPLNIHSEYIEQFDFAQPSMSKHLWLYEGVTEYSAGHVQVSEGLIDEGQFIDWISEKMRNASNYDDHLPFTEMSKGCLSTYIKQYNNVYQKGALIGMALDIRLRQLSGGEYGIQNLMTDLSGRFGANNSFEDDQLFDIITEMTYPEVRSFFTHYVEGSESLPLADLFESVGLKLEEGTVSEAVTLGQVAIGIDEREGLLQIVDDSDLNHFGKELGWKKGDLLLSLNGRQLEMQNINQVFEDFKEQTNTGDKVKVEIMRVNKKGKLRRIKLKAKAEKVLTVSNQSLALNPRASASQIALRQAWMGTGPKN